MTDKKAPGFLRGLVFPPPPERIASAASQGAGEPQQVVHEERAGRAAVLRRPWSARVEVGVVVGIDEPENDLGDDAAAGRPEPRAVVENLALLQDAVPQRRLAAPG